MNAEYEDNVRKVTGHLNLLRAMRDRAAAPEEAAEACVQAMKKYGYMAEELGMIREQQEMLNLAVELGHPEEYRELKKLLFESEAMCESVFNTFSLPIFSMLDDLGIEYTFKYRMKSVYSIWQKMYVGKKQFDDVYDLFATRIVYKTPPSVTPLSAPNSLDLLPEVDAVRRDMLSTIDAERLWCWRIYNVISSLYRIHPDRIRDWVTHPKPSGYQALQMTVMGPDCNWVEIQIRSERMDYEAEHGRASHVSYKRETLNGG